MTTMAIWFEPHDNALWFVGDSRVVRDNKIEGVITDSASKIFPLTALCHQPDDKGFFTKAVAGINLGFAYAGSTLPALMTYSVANAALQNLMGNHNTPVPPIEEIANLVARVAERYVRETSSSFECAVGGWSLQSKAFELYHIAPDFSSSPVSVRAAAHTIGLPDQYLLLGSHRDEVKGLVEAKLKELSRQNLKRAPSVVIRKLIADSVYHEIGGTLQIGMAHRGGFELRQTLRMSDDPPKAELVFLGLAIDELGAVGEYRFGMTGQI